MRVGMDYHIHTYYQRCGNETMTVANVIRKAEQLGLTSIAITDHLNRLEQLEAFRYIKADIEAIETPVDVYFGAELNFNRLDGDFAYSQEIEDEYEFEVIIGGIHSTYTDSQDRREVLDIQHRHFMRTLTDPLVDVLVHPFWFGRKEVAARSAEWWEQFLDEIPESYLQEWAQASRENHCAIELNSDAIFFYDAVSAGFKARYIAMVETLAQMGTLFSVGSDAHDITKMGRTDYLEGLLHGLKIGPEQVWRPQHR
jgi:histidinol phosphatase-like PHP family hydrolase